MWLSRQLSKIANTRDPTIYVADYPFGVPYIIAQLSANHKNLWVQLDSGDKDDPILQGDKLVDAVNAVLGDQVLQYGIHYKYGLAALSGFSHFLGIDTICLSSAEYGLDLANELLETIHPNPKVIIAFQENPERFKLPHKALVVTEKNLRLTLEEAEEIASEQLPKKTLQNLLKKSQYAYENFLIAINDVLKLLPPQRPSAYGMQQTPQYAPSVKPPTLLNVLLQRKLWVEALELAVTTTPEKVSEVLKKASRDIWRGKGYPDRISSLLLMLPLETKRDPLVLKTLLFACVHSDKLQATNEELDELIEQTREYLNKQDDPDLQAQYADILFAMKNPANFLSEAESAYKKKETPLTHYSYGEGLGLSDPQKGYAILKSGLRLAEEHGDDYLTILCSRRHSRQDPTHLGCTRAPPSGQTGG